MSYICKLKLFETLIWAETEGGGGRGYPGPAPGKLQVVIYFQEEKTGTNFPGEAIPPPPAPVGVVWISTRMSDGGILFFIFSRFSYHTF